MSVIGGLRCRIEVMKAFTGLADIFSLFPLISLLHTGSSYAGSDSLQATRSDYVFRHRQRLGADEEIPCDLSEEQTCNKPGTSYPWEELQEFITDNQGMVKRMYGDIKAKRSGPRAQGIVETRMARMDEAKSWNICPTREEYEKPYWGLSRDERNLTIVNIPDMLDQIVRTETCLIEGCSRRCKDGCECRQQYSWFKLLAFDRESPCRGIFTEWFKFKSACSCFCSFDPEEEQEPLESTAKPTSPSIDNILRLNVSVEANTLHIDEIEGKSLMPPEREVTTGSGPVSSEEPSMSTETTSPILVDRITQPLRTALFTIPASPPTTTSETSTSTMSTETSAETTTATTPRSSTGESITSTFAVGSLKFLQEYIDQFTNGTRRFIVLAKPFRLSQVVATQTTPPTTMAAATTAPPTTPTTTPPTTTASPEPVPSTAMTTIRRAPFTKSTTMMSNQIREEKSEFNQDVHKDVTRMRQTVGTSYWNRLHPRTLRAPRV